MWTFEFTPCGQSKVERSPLNCWGYTTLSLSEIHQHTMYQFLNELLELYVELVNTGNDIILAGDFNIHYLENDDMQAEQFQDMMEFIRLQ